MTTRNARADFMPIMLTLGDMSARWSSMRSASTVFFDAIGEMPLSAEIGYLPEEEYHVQEEERKPKLEIRAGASGVFVLLEDLQVIRGSRFYYFYEDGMIYRSSEALKAKTGDFFDYMERQAGGGMLHCGGGTAVVLPGSAAAFKRDVPGDGGGLR